jgi:hypothetical protein
MTIDGLEAKIRALVVEMVESRPSPPRFDQLQLPDVEATRFKAQPDHAPVRPRRRVAVMAVGVGLLMVALVAFGIWVGTERSPSRAIRSEPAVPSCSTRVRAVPPSGVPRQIKVWTAGRPVVGAGSIWTDVLDLGLRPVTLSDGTYSAKVPWYLLPPGHTPAITGHRLDGKGVFRSDANVAYEGSKVFATSSLGFSTTGCWQVTGRYNGSAVTFRINVSATGPSVSARFLPRDLRATSAGSAFAHLYGVPAGSPGASPSNPAPRPPSNIPAPDVTVAASAGWTSSRPGTLRGVVVVFEQGSAAALAQVMALGGQTPAPVQLGGRSVIVESSPVIDETIATWRESPTVVALLHSRGLQTAELQQVIAGLRFAQN